MCPPESRSDRNGKTGYGWYGVLVEERLSAETRRGVRACACIWLTPSRGICHAIARPLAVSRPVDREERIPGPRVTEMKSGLRFWTGQPWTVMAGVDDKAVLGISGSERRLLAIRVPRLLW